jgi:metal-responsive CopG/Arc/MetJ family transcriptional regulator
MIKGSGTTVNVAITLPVRMRKQVDKARYDMGISRSTFICKAIEQYLDSRYEKEN